MKWWFYLLLLSIGLTITSVFFSQNYSILKVKPFVVFESQNKFIEPKTESTNTDGTTTASTSTSTLTLSTLTIRTSTPSYVPFWVKPQNVKPVLSPKNVCLKNQGENVDILLYALTRMDDFRTRILIRQTWANKTKFPFSELLFVLGLSMNDTLNRLVFDENEKYGDIYQSDFIDTYKNLSYKSITAWRWISKNCMNAKLIVRSDDDMIVNLDSIHTDQMKNLISLSNTFTCLYLDNSYALRDKNHKYYMPFVEYNQTFYKIYCDGRGTIMSTDLIPKLYNYSYVNNNLWIDDANVGEIASYFKPNFKFIGNKYIEKWQISHQKFSFKNYYFIREVGYHDNLINTWNRVENT